jgi:hypothetical protein
LPLLLKLTGSTVIKRKNCLTFIMSDIVQAGVTKKASAYISADAAPLRKVTFFI